MVMLSCSLPVVWSVVGVGVAEGVDAVGVGVIDASPAGGDKLSAGVGVTLGIVVGVGETVGVGVSFGVGVAVTVGNIVSVGVGVSVGETVVEGVTVGVVWSGVGDGCSIVGDGVAS